MRQGGSGSGGREGVAGWRVNMGTIEEETERGTDGTREREEGGSERMKEEWEGREQPSEGEEQGMSEGRRGQGRETSKEVP